MPGILPEANLILLNSYLKNIDLKSGKSIRKSDGLSLSKNKSIYKYNPFKGGKILISGGKVRDRDENRLG